MGWHKYVWSTYGVCMEYVWSTYGVCMEWRMKYQWSAYKVSLLCL